MTDHYDITPLTAAIRNLVHHVQSGGKFSPEQLALLGGMTDKLNTLFNKLKQQTP